MSHILSVNICNSHLFWHEKKIESGWHSKSITIVIIWANCKSFKLMINYAAKFNWIWPRVMLIKILKKVYTVNVDIFHSWGKFYHLHIFIWLNKIKPTDYSYKYISYGKDILLKPFNVQAKTCCQLKRH